MDGTVVTTHPIIQSVASATHFRVPRSKYPWGDPKGHTSLRSRNFTSLHCASNFTGARPHFHHPPPPPPPTPPGKRSPNSSSNTASRTASPSPPSKRAVPEFQHSWPPPHDKRCTASHRPHAIRTAMVPDAEKSPLSFSKIWSELYLWLAEVPVSWPTGEITPARLRLQPAKTTLADAV